MSDNNVDNINKGLQDAIHISDQKDNYGDSLRSYLLEIGTSFTQVSHGNCGLSKDEILKRFHLVEGNSGYLIFLWQGTGLYVDCKEERLPEPDDFWRYGEDSSDKLTSVHIFFSEISNTELGVDIRDELGLFSSHYKNYHEIIEIAKAPEFFNILIQVFKN